MSNITREEALKQIKKVIYSDILTDKNDKFRDIEVIFLAYVAENQQPPRLSEDIEKILYNLAWLDHRALEDGVHEQIANLIKQHIQHLKIDNYQQKNLLKKYHNNDFPRLYKRLEQQDQELQAQASEIGSLKKKLNAIREVFKPYEYDMDWIIKQMNEILKEE